MAEIPVVIEEFQFVPQSVSVSAGDTVRWTNNDDVDHRSTSDEPGWDSGRIVPGARFFHQFTSAGILAYHCAFHPLMRGTVTVQ
ncbi:plastocyanin/azurin family copper-binding protein [Streptomyces netropsis]|uniref:plastocyanin/azurin family copper-binding protein n=1 Tax=Streptomyces netropsis TaxID=55404 RepID=UPI003799AC08